ncbi:Zinc transporter ZTP29 [Galdieria sulphuraria]|nr:Zinc transporter ZTP29 [Galdieria sulphuraria]
MLASEIEANTPVALLLTTLAGISTGIGGILVVLQSSLSYPKLGIWQGAAAGFMLSVMLIPEPDLSQVPEIEVAMGIAIHNFPEGIAVCFASLKGIRFGVPLAIAIGLHNIPEAFLSGLAEPAGVVLVVFFAKYFLTETFVAYLLAAVGGIMSSLSIVELVPQAWKYAGMRNGFLSITGGFLLMTLLLKTVSLLHIGIE